MMLPWISALLGYIFFRLPGALLGYFVGSLFSRMSEAPNGGIPFANRPAPLEFELNLLALSAVIIKSDGEAHKEELAFVRKFFITQYGPEHAQEIFQKFNAETKQQKQQLGTLTEYFNSRTRYATRLQLLHFLFGVADADGRICDAEVSKLQQIAQAFRILQPDYESIRAMFIKDTDQAYKILEVASDASPEAIKKAYRNMVKKYHPDRLKTKDPALIKGAQEKFRQVQEAYETLKKKHQF